MLNGFKEFCQEFLTDLRVPDTDRIGEVDDGWTVGTRWMFHERMLHHSPYVTMPASDAQSGAGAGAVLRAARDERALRRSPGPRPGRRGLHARPGRRTAPGAACGDGMASGAMSDQSAAIGRLFAGTSSSRRTTLAYEVAGADGAAWTDDDGRLVDTGTDYLMRQVACIGGGTTEMARNVISERVLGMPAGAQPRPRPPVPRRPTRTHVMATRSGTIRSTPRPEVPR